MSGYAGILDIRSGGVTRAPYRVVAPPAWLPDNATVLAERAVGGGGRRGVRRGDIQSTGRAAHAWDRGRAALAVGTAPHRRRARLPQDRPADGWRHIGPGHVAARRGTLPEVDGDGHVAYLVLDPRLPDAGRVWFTAIPLPTTPRLACLDPGRARQSRPGVERQLAPQTLWLVVAREPLPGVSPAATPRAPSPSPTATPSPSLVPLPTPQVATSGSGGVWVLNLVGDTNTQLSPDGWLPSWIPLSEAS